MNKDHILYTNYTNGDIEISAEHDGAKIDIMTKRSPDGIEKFIPSLISIIDGAECLNMTLHDLRELLLNLEHNLSDSGVMGFIRDEQENNPQGDKSLFSCGDIVTKC